MTDAKYHLSARLMHWLMALGFVFMWASGYTMTTLVDKDGPTGSWLFGLHISAGVTLLALLAARIALRLVHPPPPLPEAIRGMERKAAHLGHAALYALPALVMAVGWAGVNLGGHTVKWFGVPMPTLLPETETWAGFDLDDLTETLHMWLAYIMLAVAAGHIAAAFKHRWFDGHDVIRRMTFGGR